MLRLSSVVLQVLACPGNVGCLGRFGSAAQQQDPAGPVPREIHAVARVQVQSQLEMPPPTDLLSPERPIDSLRSLISTADRAASSRNCRNQRSNGTRPAGSS